MKAFFGNNWKKGLYDDLYDLRRYADDYPHYTVAATEGPVEVQLEFASYRYNLANFFCPDPAYYNFSADNYKYIELAAYWYKKAAEQGSPVGMRGYFCINNLP